MILCIKTSGYLLFLGFFVVVVFCYFLIILCKSLAGIKDGVKSGKSWAPLMRCILFIRTLRCCISLNFPRDQTQKKIISKNFSFSDKTWPELLMHYSAKRQCKRMSEFVQSSL